jgi:hypothetical protein
MEILIVFDWFTQESIAAAQATEWDQRDMAKVGFVVGKRGHTGRVRHDSNSRNR